MIHDPVLERLPRYHPKPRPYQGRWLEISCRIEASCPGFIISTFYAGDQKRQALFLLLAEVDRGQTGSLVERLRAAAPAVCAPGLDPLSNIGRAATVLRPRDLVAAVLGEVPDGLMGLLARMGPDPISPGRWRYHSLFRLLASAHPEDRVRARMLRQLGGTLTGQQVMIVAMLPAVLLHPIFIEKVADVAVAHRLRHFIGYLPTVCSTANYAAIRESVERIGNLSVSDWVRRWTARFDKLPHPLLISDDPELVVLATGAAMTEAGRRYSNCVSSFCTRVALGRSLFVEYRPADGRDGLLAELLRVGNYWHLHQMHASGNSRIRAGVAAALRKRLADHGILILAHAPCEAETLRAIAQLAGDYTFADEDIGGFALLEADEDHAEAQTAEEVLAALTEAPE